MKSLTYFYLRCVFTSFALLLSQLTFAACEAGTPFSPPLNQDWAGWGGDLSNSRFYSETDLRASDIPDLELQWAFGFDQVSSVIGQPVIIGDYLFIGVDTGEVYALDANTGCVHWTFVADDGVRTAPIIVELENNWVVLFGDRNAQVYSLDVNSGNLNWKVKVEDHPAAIITGSPQFFQFSSETPKPNRLYVPVSSGEEGAAGNPEYPCCSFRGSVVALNVDNGEQIWKTYTIEGELGETSPGKFGPSGSAIWSAPTLDPERGLLYVATGDAYSAPADISSDAIIAMDMLTGDIRWLTQDTANDIWVVACMRPGNGGDCGPDHDFGSPPILATVDGRQLLIAGQKSGNVWAHDPESGAVVWRSPLVEDTTRFGGKIIWGGAVDAANAYFGLGPGGIGAVQLSDGELLWFNDLQPTAEMESHPGHDGPLTAIEGAVFSGGWDGVLRALSTQNGEVIWEFNTAQDFASVNGISASGGSMGAAGPVIANGKLYVPSGYVGVKNGMPGNVLLVFGLNK